MAVPSAIQQNRNLTVLNGVASSSTEPPIIGGELNFEGYVANGEPFTITTNGFFNFGTRVNQKPVYFNDGSTKTGSSLGRVTSDIYSSIATVETDQPNGALASAIRFNIQASFANRLYDGTSFDPDKPLIINLERFYQRDITDPTYQSGGDYNLKTNRFFGDVSTEGGNPQNFYIGYQGSEGATSARVGAEYIDQGSVSGSKAYIAGIPAGQWLNEEIIFINSSAPNEPDGKLYHYRNNVLLNSDAQDHTLITYSTLYPTKPNTDWGDQWSNSSSAVGPQYIWTGLHLRDDEWQGIYIGNAATLSSCTIQPIRLPQTSWSNNSISGVFYETRIAPENCYFYIRTGYNTWISETGLKPSQSNLIAHGNTYDLTIPLVVTREDNNVGDYEFEGHRHLAYRATDFSNVTSTTPSSNTKSGWQEFLDGLFPIQTSDDFNSEATESGLTVELTGGPAQSGVWIKRQITTAVEAAYPLNARLRNINICENNLEGETFKPAVYLSYYLKPATQTEVGKAARIYWEQNEDPTCSLWNNYFVSEQYHTNRIEGGIPENNFDGLFSDQSGSTVAPINDWIRIEILIDYENGFHAQLANGVLLTDTSRSYNGIINGQVEVGGVIRYAVLGNTVEAHGDSGFHVGWGMPVFDYTLKRIELADSSNWETKTNSVYQPCTTWVAGVSNTSAQIVINQGNFSNLENKHLFYVDGITATYIGELT